MGKEVEKELTLEYYALLRDALFCAGSSITKENLVELFADVLAFYWEDFNGAFDE